MLVVVPSIGDGRRQNRTNEFNIAKSLLGKMMYQLLDGIVDFMLLIC
jgi:hypothetical protein